MGTIDYRFTIVNPAAAVPFQPGDLVVDAAHWQVTSLRGHARPYIADVPTGDGQEVDLVTGKVTDGAYRVRVIDIQGTIGGSTGAFEGFEFPTFLNHITQNWSGPTYVGDWSAASQIDPLDGSVINGPIFAILGPLLFSPGAVWARRIFTASDGLQPLTTYTVRMRYRNHGQSILLSLTDANGNFVQATPPQPFIRIVGGGRTDGRRIGNGFAPFSPYLEEITVTGVTDAAGTLVVEFGADQAVGYMQWAMFVDWLRITEGTPATTGRYVTQALADGNARQQMLGRQAYLEYSFDRGTSWSKVLYSGYIDDIQLPESLVYEFAISDSRRAERITRAFVRSTVHFDNITCLIGGPSLRGWEPLLPYFGLPTFEIEGFRAATFNASQELLTPGEVTLKYDSGPMPEGYKVSGDNLTRSNFDVINERARSFWVPDASASVFNGRSQINNQRLSAGSFPGLRVKIEDPNGVFQTGGEALADEYTPWSWIASPPRIFLAGVGVIDLAIIRPWPDTLLGEGGRIRIPWHYNSLFVPPPTIGGRVKVAVYTTEIGPDYPLHIAMHPVDIVRFLYADYNIAFDTNSADTVKEALGSQLRVYMRVTASEFIQPFIEKLFGAFGFSTRMENGERVFFVLRRKSSTLPTVNVQVNTLREEGGPTFQLATNTKCNQVRVSQTRFFLSTEHDSEKRAWDDIDSKEQEVVADLVASWPGRGTPGHPIFPIGYVRPAMDADTFGERPQEFEIPGQLYIDSVGELPVVPFARGLAEDVFDRAGRGMQTTVLVTRRAAGADDLALGDENITDIPHHPNAQLDRTPSSERGGQRVSTVIRRVEEPEGVLYTVVDAGTGTVPAGIGPLPGDWTVTPDPNDPSVVIFDIHPATGATRNFAEALVNANGRIAMQIAFSVSEPVADGIHYTTIDPAEYMYTPIIPGVGDYKIPLGPFATTQGLWVRIRTFVPGTTPSAWSDWENVAGGLPPGSGDISALVVGVITDTTIALGWTNTDTSNPITVYISPAGLSQWVLVASLPAGSIQYTITGLTPGTDYDIRVILAARGTTLSTTQTTTNSGLPTLPAPTNVFAFTGSDPNVPPGNGTGIYGLSAVALVVPSMMIFEYAEETAAGSNTPSTFREWTREPSVNGGPTSSTTSAPADGKDRFVRAKLRASGWNDSPYTSPIQIDPWLAGVIIPGNPIVSPGNPIVIPPGNVSPAPPITLPTPVLPPPGTGPVRAVAQLVAYGVASDAAGTGTIRTGRLSFAMRISSNSPVRVRLYDTDAHRTADAARAIDTDSVSGTGLVMDVVLVAANAMDVRFSERFALGSTDRPATGSDTLYYSLHNLSASTADIAVDLDLEIVAT